MSKLDEDRKVSVRLEVSLPPCVKKVSETQCSVVDLGHLTHLQMHHVKRWELPWKIPKVTQNVRVFCEDFLGGKQQVGGC